MKRIVFLFASLSVFFSFYFVSNSSAVHGGPAVVRQQYETWMEERTDRAKTSPTSFINVDHAAYLRPGQTVYVPNVKKGEDLGDMFWSSEPPRGDYLTVKYEADAGRAFLIGDFGNVDVMAFDKTWPLDNGATIIASPFEKTGVRVRIHNPDHPNQKAFRALDRFESFQYDPRAVVVATFRRHSEPKDFHFTTHQDLEGTINEVGAVSFRYGEKEIQFRALSSNADTIRRLYFFFRDQTSGKETYGGGREIIRNFPEDKYPDGLLDGDQFLLDLNRAQNFYCAHNSNWNCPTGGTQKIDVPIRAGEIKPTYGSHARKN